MCNIGSIERDLGNTVNHICTDTWKDVKDPNKNNLIYISFRSRTARKDAPNFHAFHIHEQIKMLLWSLDHLQYRGNILLNIGKLVPYSSSLLNLLVHFCTMYFVPQFKNYQHVYLKF